MDERRDQRASLLLVVGQNSTAPRHSGTMIRRFDPWTDAGRLFGHLPTLDCPL